MPLVSAQGVAEHRVGIGRGHRRVEDVSRDDDHIDVLGDHQLGHRLRHDSKVIEGRMRMKRAPDVPVGRVEDLHARSVTGHGDIRAAPRALGWRGALPEAQ